MSCSSGEPRKWVNRASTASSRRPVIPEISASRWVPMSEQQAVEPARLGSMRQVDCPLFCAAVETISQS